MFENSEVSEVFLSIVNSFIPTNLQVFWLSVRLSWCLSLVMYRASALQLLLVLMG